MPTIKYDEIYELEMYNRSTGGGTAFCDLLVTDDAFTIFVANLIGKDTKVKQACWQMQDGKTGNIHRAEGNRYESGHFRSSVYSMATKKNMYDEEVMKIDDLTQVLMVTKNAKPDIKARNAWQAEQDERIKSGGQPHVLPDYLSELILAWDGDYRKQVYEVLDDRYNTPMLPEWKDDILDALIDRDYYEPLNVYTFGSDYLLEAGLLRITEAQLEEIITEAIQGYQFEFAIEEDGRRPEEGILHEITSIDDYLSNFAGSLGGVIQKNIGLRFDPEKDAHHPAFRDVNLQANENGITGLYPPQANTVMGVSKTLVDEKYCFVVGEMGTGKTTMGEIVPYMTEAMLQNVDTNPSPQRVIVMAPAIMVEKWAREIKERVPNCDTYQINHWKDVKAIQDKYAYTDAKGKTKYRKPERWEYFIMSSETPKFTYPMEPIKNWRTDKDDITRYTVDEVDESEIRIVQRMAKGEDGRYHLVQERVVNPQNKIQMVSIEIENLAESRPRYIHRSGETGFYCPNCGGPLTKRGGDISEEHFFETFSKSSANGWAKKMSQENLVCKNEIPTAKLPKTQIKEWTFSKTKETYVPAKIHQKCGFVLWQPEVLPADSGYRKVSPAWYINKHLPRGFFKYLIADEVHEYKSGDSSTGRAFGQLVNHTEKQILLTGTLMGGMSRDIFYLLARLNPKRLLKESINYSDESAFNARYGITEFSTRFAGGTSRKTSNQKPGISPHLFPMHLMSNCAFLELNDMGYALPPYQEIPVVVDMTEKHKEAYDEIAHEIMSTMRTTEGLGGLNSISIFMNAMYQYADTPFNMREIIAYDQSGVQHILGTPYNFNQDEFVPTKVEELIRNIDEGLYHPEPLVGADGEEIPSPPRKSLVYVKYTGKESFNQMDIYLYEILKMRGYKVGILKSGGSYDGIKMPKNSRAREQWLHDMMEKHDWDILVTNPRLVKVGLDLLTFPNIHFFQLDYSTYDYMQASRRSWRLKQTLPVKVYTYVYRETIQEKALQHIAKKIDAAMAMQGKFSEEGLRAMADSADGMNALAKQLMSDNVLEDVETVHDIFARKNSSFDEMQSVEFQDYDGYVMNPIEGGIETVRRIAEGIITRVEEEHKAGRATIEEVKRTRTAVTNYLDMFEEVIKTISTDEVKAYNRGVAKKNKVIEGQQELDLFAL